MNEIDTNPQTLSLREMENVFPLFLPWVEKTGRAQIYDGKRLLSPEEKIARRGAEKISAVLHEFSFVIRPLVLEACRQDAIVVPEIIRFASLLGFNTKDIWVRAALAELISGDELNLSSIDTIERVRYITKQEDNFFEVRELMGFKTNENGMRQLVRRANPKTKPIFQDLFNPNPKRV